MDTNALPCPRCQAGRMFGEDDSGVCLNCGYRGATMADLAAMHATSFKRDPSPSDWAAITDGPGRMCVGDPLPVLKEPPGFKPDLPDRVGRQSSPEPRVAEGGDCHAI